jgi:hypothetical protein
MTDILALEDPSDTLWRERLRRETRQLIMDRTALVLQVREHGEIPRDTTYLGGQPLLRRRGSLAESNWFVLDREYLWRVATGTRPTACPDVGASDSPALEGRAQRVEWVETDRGPARAVRLPRTENVEIALENLLGRLYRLRAEAAAAGLRWADLASSAIATQLVTGD